MLRLLLVGLMVTTSMGFAQSEPAAALDALAKMPIKEVTVFKDGHAHVIHQSAMPVDTAGNVVLDLLPNPIMGTFWPFSVDKKAKLQSVTASRRRVKIDRTAMTIRELIEANPGRDAIITEGNKPPFQATILRLLSQSSEELETTSLPGTEVLPVKGHVLLLKTIDGTRAVPIESISDLKFTGPYETKLSSEEYRNVLTLKLDWGGQPPEKTAEVGMAYVQKGFRWIPSYRVELDGKGKALVKLQATLLNELTDMKDATVNLVIGVPTFYFKDMTDPIALSQAMAQLSPHFQDPSLMNVASFSNGMATQVMGQAGGFGGGRPAAAPAPAANLGPEISGSQSEDLFVFTVKNISLGKSQRMVFPVNQQEVETKDVYTLDIPYAPPVEVQRQVNDARMTELAKLMAAPKVMHKIRLTNGQKQPFTTAPALIVKDGKVLSQGMMTYTSMGGSVDLTLTTAVDVKVKKRDKETKRTPNAQNFNGDQYWRIDIASSLELANYGSKPVEVEVTRYVLGNLDKAGDNVKTEMVNLIEEDDQIGARPLWWAYYPWPSWWGHFNGIGRVTWTAKLEPGKSNEQSYSWYYYWR